MEYYGLENVEIDSTRVATMRGVNAASIKIGPVDSKRKAG